MVALFPLVQEWASKSAHLQACGWTQGVRARVHVCTCTCVWYVRACVCVYVCSGLWASGLALSKFTPTCCSISLCHPGKTHKVVICTWEWPLGKSPCLKFRKTCVQSCTSLNWPSFVILVLIEYLLVMVLQTVRLCFRKSSITEWNLPFSWGAPHSELFEFGGWQEGVEIDNVTYDVASLKAHRPQKASWLREHFRCRKAVHHAQK